MLYTVLRAKTYSDISKPKQSYIQGVLKLPLKIVLSE